MKLVLLLSVLWFPGGEETRGLQAMAEGRYPEAVTAFQTALVRRPGDARLHYNLALAAWRAGDVETAETAAEKAATLSNGQLAPLRDGILGNLRFDAAQKVATGTEPDLSQALKVAEQALTHFERGASRSPVPELLRNYERAHLLVEDLKKRLAEQKDEQDKGEDGEQGKEGEPKPDEDKDGKQDQGQKSDGQDPDGKPEQGKEPPPGSEEEQKESEPKPRSEETGEGEEEQEPQPQPQPEDKSKDDGSKDPATSGETGEESGQPQGDHRLSPEARKRLEDMLRRLEEIQMEHRKQQKLQRSKVEKDW